MLQGEPLQSAGLNLKAVLFQDLTTCKFMIRHSSSFSDRYTSQNSNGMLIQYILAEVVKTNYKIKRIIYQMFHLSIRRTRWKSRFFKQFLTILNIKSLYYLYFFAHYFSYILLSIQFLLHQNIKWILCSYIFTICNILCWYLSVTLLKNNTILIIKRKY